MGATRWALRLAAKGAKAGIKAAVSTSKDAEQTDAADGRQRWMGVLVLALAAGFFTLFMLRGLALPAAWIAGLTLALRWPRSRGLTLSTGTYIRELARHRALSIVLGAGGTVAILIRAFVDESSPLLGLAGILAILVLNGAVAAGWTSRTLRQMELREKHGHVLSVVLQVPVTALERSILDDRDGVIQVVPTPPGAALKLDSLEERLALAWPEWAVDEARTSHSSLVLVPADVDVRDRRELLRETDGMIEGIERHTRPAERTVAVPAPFTGTIAELAKAHRGAARALGGGWQIEEVEGNELHLASGTPDPRPNAETWTLPAGVSPTAGARYAALARSRGRVLVDWCPEERRAVVASPLPAAVTLRDRFAELLRTERPWELEVALAFAVDESGEGRIDTVTLLRAPAIGAAAEKRQAVWDELVAAIPGGNPGWDATEDPVTGVVTLTYGEPRSLQDLVPLADILPDAVDPDAWNLLPLGRDPQGDLIGLDLKLGPQSMIVGPTGSGKTIALIALMTGALARGFDVWLTDAMKGGADFERLRPWATEWAETLDSASAQILKVYAEVERRKALLKRAGVGFWRDLDEATREREGVRPILYLIDEYVSMVLPVPVPAALKGDPLEAELNELNAAKSVVATYAGKIAREARFVGVHLLIAMQRPDATYISGEFRSNLTSIVQLAKPGTIPAREALNMAFPGEQVNAAAERLAELDDGVSRGLAIIGAEGGRAEGLRVAYAPAEALPGLLEARGIPRVERPAPHAQPAEAGKVENLPGLELSLDDLDEPDDILEGLEILDH